MMCQEFTEDDIASLPALEPEGWGDIRPRFDYFLKSQYCKPIKIEQNGELAAVGTTIFHVDTVWFACIITHPGHRNKGLGGAITRHLIESSNPERYRTIYLDATEFGYPVYLKQGFEVEGQYAHLRREGDGPEKPQTPLIRPFTENFREAAYELDAWVSGEDRRGVMAEFLKDALLYVDSEDHLQGIYFPTWSDGMIIAFNNAAGLLLMQYRASEKPFAVLPVENEAGLQFLQENGYQILKTSRRMVRGERRIRRPELLYNRISGALG